ncbi:SCO family protein [Stenotrophomonas sp. MYb238]|uniref:SCO family protein n=1 Tax=Stenotrophomonas sp. MYb238 TaxID=2040281 RepID=UPI001291BFA5|nr:SCO family protein [Stenotrophomonas sp. MYb238]MQP74503.1 SCO family protein [Stenotrophomonas sp. MYb238]
MNRPFAFLLLGLALAIAPTLHAADAPATPAAALPGQSLYHLQVVLTDQNGRSVPWASLRGRPQLVSMFYGNCHLMCPLIIENAKAVQKQLPADQRARLDVAMLTLDPVRDTPAALAEIAQRHRAPDGWRFLRPAEGDVRALANLLDVRYRFREDGSINHTSVLVLLDAEGRVRARSEVQGMVPDPELVASIEAVLAER